MKNKKIYVILIVLILIGSLFLTYNIYQNKNKVIKTKKRKQNNLAIMIKEDGATDYIKSNSKDIPKGDYVLNYEKSYCKNNGVIGDYDSSLGKVSFSFLGTDSCYLYFDYKPGGLLYETIEKRYNQDKTYLGLYDGEGADTYANPVYYYKGNVQNNNVLFAGFCWKIVRTTETGGVKIVYNGVQKNGSCNNTGTDSQIGESVFNSSSNSLAYVGYMHNIVYPTSSKSMSSQSNIVFGNSFTYNNGTYTLTDTKTVATWSSGYNTINNNHYTCMTTGTTCSSVYYVYATYSTSAYYITLTNGKSVNDALIEMLYANNVNKNDSKIKNYIDKWYITNLRIYQDKLEDTVFCNDRRISYLGNRCYGIKCDVSKEDDVKLVVETTLKNYHKIDFLVANAGIGGSANKPHELSFEEYNKVISVNQNGIFLFNKYVISSMLENGGGAIVNTSSMFGVVGTNSAFAYSVSKGAINNMTRSLALTYAKDNIRVNAIAPGYVDTPILKDVPKEYKDVMASSIPMGRLGKDSEIANLICYLLSDEASFITGDIVSIDGGFTAA